MRPTDTRASVVEEQNAAAAASDVAAAAAAAAAEEAGVEVVPGDGVHPVLPTGPDLTVSALAGRILAVAASLHDQADADPAAVAKVFDFELPPDGKNRRHGVVGALDHGQYRIAVWKPYVKHPGHIIEVEVLPHGSCEMAWRSLQEPLADAGFQMTPAAVGSDQRIMFNKKVRDGLELLVAVETNDRKQPKCAFVVTFEMEKADA